MKTLALLLAFGALDALVPKSCRSNNGNPHYNEEEDFEQAIQDSTTEMTDSVVVSGEEQVSEQNYLYNVK